MPKLQKRRRTLFFLGLASLCVSGVLIYWPELIINTDGKPSSCRPGQDCTDPTSPFQIAMPVYKYNSDQADTSAETYLKPTNLLYPELSLGRVTDESRRKMEDIVRTGVHLRPYVTERGEAAWIENGIVYRPWRKPDPKTMHKTHPSPYAADYEAYVPFNESLFFEGRKPDPGYQSKKKIILWHTPTRYAQRIPGLSPMKACPEFPCQTTLDKEYLPKSAALIFTAQLIKTSPPKRSANQVYVLHNHEPPFQNNAWQNHFRRPTWKKAINYTMTYRTDSDFVVPYGIVRKRPKPVEGKDYRAIVDQKDKPIAWLVSNCNGKSRRKEYVDELKKYINVDVYGSCGKMKCPHEEDDKCAKIIAKKYKFYLSLESTFCTDYVTEKLFHYLTMDTIVVARGSDQYFQHVPSEIYINTADFRSPKALAKKLNYLDKHDEAYIAMLKEKDKYTAVFEGYPVRNSDASIRFMAYRFEAVPLCLLCQRLWNLDLHAKSIPDSQAWFEDRICREPDDMKNWVDK